MTRCQRKSIFPKAFVVSLTSPRIPRFLVPTSIERGVWDYFSGRAKQRGVALPDLLTEVLERDIEINEALK